MSFGLDAIERALRARRHTPAAREPGDRTAAVAAILRDGRDGAELLMIRRAESEGDPWSGHMALPGGRHEPADRDLIHTAVRETAEEVGLELDHERGLIGRLDDLSASAAGRRAGLIVAPFVFAVGGEPNLVLCEREVDEAIWTPISPLARGERDTTFEWEYQGNRMHLPAFDVDGRIVWGLTHRMLRGLFALLDGSGVTGYEAWE